MLYFEYVESGIAVTEFNYERWIEKVLRFYDSGKSIRYHLCTEIPFLAVRKEVAEGKIAVEDVIFVFDGKEHRLDECANILDNLPIGMFDVSFKLVCSINRAITKNSSAVK